MTSTLHAKLRLCLKSNRADLRDCHEDRREFMQAFHPCAQHNPGAGAGPAALPLAQKLTTIDAPSTWLLFLNVPSLTFWNTARLARSSRYSALKVVLRLSR